MKQINYILLIIIALSSMLCSSSVGQAQMLQPGEYLEYRVSFWGITLGKVRIKTEEYRSLDGRKVMKAKAYMDTDLGIPFFDLHTVFNSWMDTSAVFSHKFLGSVRVDDDRWDTQKISFRNEDSKVINTKYYGKKMAYSDTIPFEKRCNDGLSLFFMARKLARTKQIVDTPTLIDREIESTTIDFKNKIESAECDAIKYPVRSVYFEGQAHWDGIYGLSGEFRGWFSDDQARVPIMAKMNVYIGSVHIELVKYERKGWKPPKAD